MNFIQGQLNGLRIVEPRVFGDSRGFLWKHGRSVNLKKTACSIVWTPYSELYHYESKSRGKVKTSEKQKLFAGEIRRLRSQWAKEPEAGGPYYNLNFTLDNSEFFVKSTVQQYDAR